jgi:hypothetical protein
LSDSIVAQERNQQGKHPEIVKFRVLKNREWGETGEAGYGIWNAKTGRLEHLDRTFAEKFMETSNNNTNTEGGAY